jgi:hypothetical protein
MSLSQGLYLNTYTHQTSMPEEEFEPTITVSERAKTVHALDRAATMTGEMRNAYKMLVEKPEENIWQIQAEVIVKLSLCLIKHHTIKTDLWSGGIAPFFNLGTRWR